MPQILKEVVEGFINLKNVIKSRIHSVISMVIFLYISIIFYLVKYF